MARTYDELQAAIWTDERNMPPGTRELALAIAWIHHSEPDARGRDMWKRVRQLTGSYPRTGSWRIHELVARDAPAYRPPNLGQGGCEGPRLRPYVPRRPAYLDRCQVSDHHPHLGDCRYWFCSRHKDRAAEVKRQVEARGEPPEPVPNHGGLLPRYFEGNWAAIYARHCDKHCTPWRVPYYGADADQWPVPGTTLIPKRPRLSVVQSA